MITYDILNKNISMPTVPHATGTLIRGVYDHEGFISQLVGTHTNYGVDLFLMARQGLAHITARNAIHHHVSILSKSAVEYADALNTKKFIIQYLRKDKTKFLIQRFPEWTYIGIMDNGLTRMELSI